MLGKIFEQKGWKGKAIEHYEKFIYLFIRIWFLSLLWFTLIFIRFSPADIHSRIDYSENL